jgi:hypothetical protein
MNKTYHPSGGGFEPFRTLTIFDWIKQIIYKRIIYFASILLISRFSVLFITLNKTNYYIPFFFKQIQWTKRKHTYTQKKKSTIINNIVSKFGLFLISNSTFTSEYQTWRIRCWAPTANIEKTEIERKQYDINEIG